MRINKLEKRRDGLYTTKRKPYMIFGEFKHITVKKVFDFAWEMTFGNIGEHRNHRSGGSIKRKKGQIFADTFQGKLAECGFYNLMYHYSDIKEPDFEKYDLGRWDQYDFEVNGKKVAIKSTKRFGQLLLLETKDWTSNGKYKPNLGTEYEEYDFFVLLRIDPACESLLKKNKILYSNNIEKEVLYNIITSEKWAYDIVGYISNDDLINIINNRMIIKKGEFLNGRTKMDAENYYIQAGDMKDIKELINIIADIKSKDIIEGNSIFNIR